jgi:hypothetical protein
MTGTEKHSGGADFAMTELDQRLRGVAGAAVSAAVLERFSRLIKQLEAAKGSGLPPEDFAATETVLKAVAAAVEVVVAFRKFHQFSSDEDCDQAEDKTCTKLKWNRTENN